MSESREFVRAHLQAGADVKARAADECADDIVRAAVLIGDALAAGGKILLCGNGGSAADCQHMAAEFVSRLTADFARPAIPAIALTTDTSFLTAYANDIDFLGVFARQVEALGRPGDVLIGISTSGRSGNVLRAAETARARRMSVVVLMGRSGPLADLADVAIKVPSPSTQHIQECHLSIEHVLCHLVERRLFPGESGTGQAQV
jgi:D-sedoheptulose 7-phosphate isomerase